MVAALSLFLLAQQPTPKPTLPEPVRQVAYMALLGIALLGMLLIVGTLLGGHWVRRWGDRRRRPAVPPDAIPPTSKSNQPTPEWTEKEINDGETHGTDDTQAS